MEIDQFLEPLHFERHTGSNADRANRQDFDDPLHFDWPIWANSLADREAHHLWAEKEGMSGVAFTGVDLELFHLLTEQLLHGIAGKLVGEIEGKHVNRLPPISGRTRVHRSHKLSDE